MAEDRRLTFQGILGEFMVDTTPFVDLEGALNCGKTTACLAKELSWLRRAPGIWSFMCRYADGDNSALLLPAWERLLNEARVAPKWNSEEKSYDFENKSRMFSFGIRPQDQLGRYSKLRGLGVSRIYVDQPEELPPDYFGELAQRQRQSGYTHQFTLSPNPMNRDSWLAEQFPERDKRARFNIWQSMPDRRYYAVSLFDNAHNLPAAKIAAALSIYPPTHPKHRTMILGLRGLNVVGQAVYRSQYVQDVHHVRLGYSRSLPLLVGIDFGKHHPCAVFCQMPYYGGLHVLGGLLGQDMYIDDFAPLVKRYLAEWFPKVPEVKYCCDPAGTHQNSQGTRFTGLDILKQNGIKPVRFKDNSNAPDVRGACIEKIGGYMHRRTVNGECFAVNDAPLFLVLTPEQAMPEAFVADGLAGGYVWDDHMVSVGSKQMRRPKKDGYYEHGMNCLEYIELNFGAKLGPMSEDDKRRAAGRVAQDKLAAVALDHWMAS